MTVSVLFITFLFFMLIGVPIAMATGLSALITIIFVTDIPTYTLIQQGFTSLDSFSLLSLPLFILAGVLMESGGVSRRLLKFAEVLVGYLTGGLAMATVLASMFFGTISGSGPATVSAVGSFMTPAMINKGYDRGFASAVPAVSGSIGAIIPPSISFVILGLVSGLSISSLFLAGIIPGILIGICLMFTAYIIAKKDNYPVIGKPPTFLELLKSLNDSKWALSVPIVVLGGIYGGVFSPTEAAAVACVYSIIISVVFYRELTFKKLADAFFKSALVNISISIIIGFSISFSYILSIEKVPEIIANYITSISESPFIIMLLINLLLLIVGMFFDIIPSIIILTPIFLPIVMELGFDPIHFGVIMVINLAIGFATPPLGVSLFLTARFANIPVERTIISSIPFILAMLVALLIVILLPSLSLYIPNLTN